MLVVKLHVHEVSIPSNYCTRYFSNITSFQSIFHYYKQNFVNFNEKQTFVKLHLYTSVFLGFEGLNFEDGELKGEEGISKRGDDGSDNGTGDEGIDNGTGDEGEVEDVGFVLVEELR